MKTLFASAIALAVTTAGIGWAEPAAAEEPFELKQTQLDHVTAGNGDDRVLEVVTLNFAKNLPPHDPSSDVILEMEFSLRVHSPGTELSRDNGWYVTKPTVVIRGE